MPRQQKITFGEMRASGASRIIVHCGDYKCNHLVTISADRWADDVRLSDLEPDFVARKCGRSFRRPEGGPVETRALVRQICPRPRFAAIWQ
jgi:hypothetical protein